MRASDSVFKKIPFFIGVGLLVLFCLGGISIAVLHSPWAQKKMFSALGRALEESGWKISAEAIEGSVFQEIRLDRVLIVSPEGLEIRAASLQAHLSAWRLLRNQIAIQNLQADQISWKKSLKTTRPQIAASLPGIPFALLFPNFSLTRIALPESNSTASLEGTLKIGRYNKRAHLDALLKKEDAAASIILALRSNGQAEFKCAYETPSLAQDLSPWSPLPGDASANLHLQIKGAWKDFLAHFTGSKPAQSIRGTLRGFCQIEKTPALQALLQRRWMLFSAIDLDPKSELTFSKLNIRGGSLFLANGSFTLSKEFGLESSNLQFTAKSLEKIGAAPIDGPLFVYLQSKEKKAEATLSSTKLMWDGFSIEQPLAHLHLAEENGIFTGSFEADAKMQNEDLRASCTIELQPKTSLDLDQIQLASSLLNAHGALTFFPNQGIVGSLAIQTPNLNQLDPTHSLYGKGNADLRWSLADGEPLLEIDAKGEDLYFAGMQAKSAAFYSNFTRSKNSIYAELLNVQKESLSIETLTIEAESADRIAWDSRFLAEGDWKGPFLFASNGVCLYERPNLTIDFLDLSGTLFFHPMTLASATKFQIGPDLFRLQNFDLLIGSASIAAAIDKEGDSMKGSLLFDRVPLDFLSLNPLDISVAGTINLGAEFSQAGDLANGSVKGEIAEIEIGTLGMPEPVEGHVLFSATLSEDLLSIATEMKIRGEDKLEFSADLPWKIRFSPYASNLSKDKSANAHLSFNGRIEEILDFFDIGPHRLEGKTACEMTLKGHLGRPHLEGRCRLEEGYYENYVTGFELKQLQAEILAEKSSLYLRSLTAKDSQNKGSFSLSGEVSLVHDERFPFLFDGTFSRLNTTDLAWMKLEAGGAVQISGNIDSARVSGQAVVLEGDVSIPERIPPSLPDLQVHYVNLIRPPPSAPPPKEGRYPIFFDYHILAPEGVYISGRGLESEWKGDFQIGGTYTAIEAKGELNMLMGGFTFAGRTFELTEGALIFSGQPKEMPILNIAAHMQLQNVILIARLKGFLNAPQLSFHSNPPLPMGSILSYLLFGQDMSDINAIQAAQIVNSLSSLSGGGSDVFDNTRRSIGLDRLRIIAKPVGEEGAQAYSLQVGKYVTKGVLVSVSQGTEKDTTNLSIEIDLPNGLVIEAESMQEEEQGKFGLKWNYNY